MKLVYVRRYYAIRPAKASWIGIHHITKMLEQGNNVHVLQARAYLFSTSLLARRRASMISWWRSNGAYHRFGLIRVGQRGPSPDLLARKGGGEWYRRFRY